MTREAFEDAITVTMALGGSTNATLHLLAIAHAANVDLSLEDFNTIPRACASFGGLETIWSVCLPRPLQSRWCACGYEDTFWRMVSFTEIRITCTGKTVAENLADFADLTPGQKVIMPLENPKRADGPLIILNGNLAPDGAVAKVSGVKVRNITLVLLRSLTQKKMPFRLF